MAEIVNLNRFRKAKAKAAEEIKANNNRLLFGRKRTDKEIDRKERENAMTELDGKKLDE
ncbi:DUF4169 family protein [Magnetospirillum sp. SS-4]|uniref:DUF4169 family protein n=1 Tax=Magnetospirillum sp. SS-4 TaxID=2681465 RepID=UPI001382811C|nr:DUF4169 family protein [Magnetospirillum sp. SS-4]CAA7625083.1 conserved hypothetical protein [Magnetospirillum sp. SS-4]